MQLADPLVPDDLARQAEPAERTLVRAVQEDAAVPLDGVAQGPALADGRGERLLAEDVLAGAHRGNRLKDVPVVGRGDDDGVDVAAGEEVAEVLVRGDAGAQALAPGLGPALPDVADGDGLGDALLEEVLEDVAAPAAEADEAQSDPLAGRQGALAPERRGREDIGCRGGHGGGTEELPARQRGGRHGHLPAAFAAHALR